ncbi:YbbR-like domain-containing protein [Mucilaginibacter aquatilis]|uniref:YbbR-like domain-containing protein n=1 Tax=Mucilaginibacter aquatilis TaxID=1517760 RepID=A0A6I4IEZ4_9SPHI|nr:YbbR-like domain-containing protein [Mucilaginibacter aquatilis]MVN92318.1 YbbR-like domain-containing protein [Mucilaginibacter aquatilis]
MPIIKLSVSERRRLSVFITCFLIATVAWILATLSGTYSFTVKQAITFKNAPQKRAFRALQPDTVEAIMQGTGWQVLFSKVSSSTEPVKVDLHTLEHSNYIALNTQIAQINKVMDARHKIIAFTPDTLYFDFTNRVVKRVPIEPVLNLTYQQQYQQSEKIQLKPAYVTLNGPGNVIEHITSWKTDTLKLDNVNQPINTTLGLQPVKEGNISIYPKSTQLKVPVEEFTEKTLSIPVKLINNVHYYNVKMVPHRVNITFTVPLSRYTELDEDFFEATADFGLWEQGYTVLPVNITRVPAYCRIVKTVPRNINFLVKK